MRLVRTLSSILLLTAFGAASAQRIEVTVPGSAPLNGHLILVIAKSDRSEPRMQMSENYQSAQGFGVDVENQAPGKPIVVDAQTFGYPLRSLNDLQPGDYFVQAVFNVYEQYPSCDRQIRLASARQGRRTEVESQAGQSL